MLLADSTENQVEVVATALDVTVQAAYGVDSARHSRRNRSGNSPGQSPFGRRENIMSIN